MALANSFFKWTWSASVEFGFTFDSKITKLDSATDFSLFPVFKLVFSFLRFKGGELLLLCLVERFLLSFFDLCAVDFADGNFCFTPHL